VKVKEEAQEEVGEEREGGREAPSGTSGVVAYATYTNLSLFLFLSLSFYVCVCVYVHARAWSAASVIRLRLVAGGSVEQSNRRVTGTGARVRKIHRQ